MGQCLTTNTISENDEISNIQDIDLVKAKLKNARDKVYNIVLAKNKQILNVQNKIKDKIPQYNATKKKKVFVPLLQTKKDLETFVENAELRLRLINDKLGEVQLNRINVDTIKALEDANIYVKMAQQQIDKKDWKNILEEAKQKCDMQWPQEEENIQNDPQFLALWEELGGNKIPILQGRLTKIILKFYIIDKKFELIQQYFMNKFEDPSTLGGYSEVYQIQKQFKLNNKLKDFEDTFMARVFKSPNSYKIELTSQNNVSFFYRCVIDTYRFSQILTQNSLTINYSELFDWLKHIFHDNLSYEFLLTSQTNGQLKIMKTEQFKIYEIARLPFEIASEQQIRQNVMYRYQRMKRRKQLLADYWNKMIHILKTKNPSLLISLQNSRRIKKVFK